LATLSLSFSFFFFFFSLTFLGEFDWVGVVGSSLTILSFFSSSFFGWAFIRLG
jgi:hypothetical protein